MFEPGIVEAIDVLKEGIADVGTGGPSVPPDTSSALRVLKKVSTAALS
jgi:hypothetical protein